MNQGYIYALLAYFLWGLFPVYWKQLEGIPAIQLIGHRIVWSFVFMVLLLTVMGQLNRLRPLLRDGRVVHTYALAGLLLAGNWLTYVWAVTHGYIVEASLGYFINPLFSVLLGLVVLRERLRPWQWTAIGLATVGVGYLTLIYGRLPWIALALTATFGLYGLVTKTAPLDALDGLTLETGLIFLPAAGFLLWQELQGRGAFGHMGLTADLLMLGSGAVTAVPLVFFGLAVRRVPLSVVGILQYLAPTLQFLLGVLAYHEPFTPTYLVGYSLVWLALVIFWVEGYVQSRQAVPL
ncbi:MAG TPA: EamA family transporter RarD [Anaerolineae bacterium]|nr:EamA family transporter RarD [Anaerolineae bacterium]HID84828.1 EamA family transporter RarD [Anaerolineales bacterium]HIQ09003.1 EamA family transporter RarD [Anaerolineaceae bacterium]